MSASANGQFLLAATNDSVWVFDRKQKRIVWSRGQSSALGWGSMITSGGAHVLLPGRPAPQDANEMRLIHWPTNTVVGRYDTIAFTGQIAPDSSYYIEAAYASLAGVSLTWPATSVSQNESALQISLLVHRSTGSITLQNLSRSTSDVQWTLVDVTGRHLAEGNTPQHGGSARIMLQQSPSIGVYFLQCQSNDIVLNTWPIHWY